MRDDGKTVGVGTSAGAMGVIVALEAPADASGGRSLRPGGITIGSLGCFAAGVVVFANRP